MINARAKRDLRVFLAAAALSGCAMVIAHLLRQLGLSFNPVLWASAEIIAALLGFTIAANILVRFHGTGDRFSLFLVGAFGLNYVIQLTGIAGLHGELLSGSGTPRVPLFWIAGGTLLGIHLLAAIGLDKCLPWPRESNKTILAVLSVVGAIAGLTGLLSLALGHGPLIYGARLIPRPWDLLPATMFLAGTILLYRNPYRLTSALGASLPWVAGVNAACHLMASQSPQLLDTPALAAQMLNCVSYMILLGGTLVDNVRLFGQVCHRAISDSLTGLE